MSGTEPDTRVVLRAAIPAPRPAEPPVPPEPSAVEPPGPADPPEPPATAQPPAAVPAPAGAPSPEGTAPEPIRHRSGRIRPLRWVGEVLGGLRRAGGGCLRWVLAGGGRFTVPVLAIIVVLAAAAGSGGWLVPALAPASTRAALPDPTDPPSHPSLDPPSTGPAVPPDAGPGGVSGRPQDGLASWAAAQSAAVDVPPVALTAYAYAELVVQSTQPSCHLHWTTLAGIGKIESDHGRTNGATLTPDGRSVPPIIGPALDGTDHNQLIRDTDHGTLDGDTQYDHAVGPMQFIPTTWKAYQIDADLDGIADPNDINDAALAAADYLCAGGKDLSTAGGWWSAVLSYNSLQSYALDVFNAANEYGARSRSVT